MKLLLLYLFLSIFVYAQVTPPPQAIRYFLGAASSSCVTGQIGIDVSTPAHYTCKNSAWVLTASTDAAALTGILSNEVQDAITRPGGTPSLSGKLMNFFTPGGVAAKKVMYFGNSTVQNAPSWYTRIFSETMTGGIFEGMSYRSDITTLASTAGVVTVTLGAAVGTDAVVGQRLTVIPLTGGTACKGSGIVTEVSGSTITVPLINGACTTLVSTASTGYISKSILNSGNNGASLAYMLADTSPTSTGLGGICAVQPDLLIVRGPLINDVRLGATSLVQAIVLIGSFLSSVRSCAPSTDIYLKTENSLLKTDVGGHGYVSPNSSAQEYSDILRQAVMAWAGRYSGVVVVDTQESLWGTTSPVTSTLMADQLHPSVAGQLLEAQQDIQILSQLKYKGFIVPGEVNPNASLAGSFSPYLASNARMQNYSVPWNTYPYACADQEYYDLVAHGFSINTITSGQNYFDFSWGVPGVIQGSDIVEQQSVGCWLLPTTAVAGLNGATNTRVQMNGGGTTPNAFVANEQVNVWRPKFGNQAAEAYVRDTTAYPYRRRIVITASGSGYFDFALNANEHMNAWGSSVTTSDTLVLSTSGVVSLSGCNFVSNSANIRCLKSGDWSAYSSPTLQYGWVFGAHPYEGQPDTTNKIAFSNLTPAVTTEACTARSVWADASFVYVCVASGNIKRVAIAAW